MASVLQRANRMKRSAAFFVTMAAAPAVPAFAAHNQGTYSCETRYYAICKTYSGNAPGVCENLLVESKTTHQWRYKDGTRVPCN